MNPPPPPAAAPPGAVAAQSRPADKSPDAFRTISEVAEGLDLPQHVLRFWETRFPQIKPLKRGGGRRYYRPDDVALLRGIRHLLYGQGYTIKGVQRILREEGPRFVQAVGRGERTVEAPRAGDAGDELRTEATGEAAGEPFRLLPEEPSRAQGEPGARRAALAEVLGVALDELLECQRVLSTLADDPASADR
jgi:DNA-binding transcriptional MerR regulator